MEMIQLLGWISILAGIPFFLSGTVGLLRFPDIYTRLHALTKADNVGLGLLVFGLCLQAENVLMAGKLLLIWVLVLIASSASCHLVARSAMDKKIEPWTGK